MVEVVFLDLEQLRVGRRMKMSSRFLSEAGEYFAVCTFIIPDPTQWSDPKTIPPLGSTNSSFPTHLV